MNASVTTAARSGNEYKDAARLRKVLAIAAAIREQARRQNASMTAGAVRFLTAAKRRDFEELARVNRSSDDTWSIVAEQFPDVSAAPACSRCFHVFDNGEVAHPVDDKLECQRCRDARPCWKCEAGPRVAEGLCALCLPPYKAAIAEERNAAGFTAAEVAEIRNKATHNHPHYPVVRCADCAVGMVAQDGVYTDNRLVCLLCWHKWDAAQPLPFEPGECYLCKRHVERPSRGYCVRVHFECAARASSEG